MDKKREGCAGDIATNCLIIEFSARIIEKDVLREISSQAGDAILTSVISICSKSFQLKIRIITLTENLFSFKIVLRVISEMSV